MKSDPPRNPAAEAEMMINSLRGYRLQFDMVSKATGLSTRTLVRKVWPELFPIKKDNKKGHRRRG